MTPLEAVFEMVEMASWRAIRAFSGFFCSTAVSTAFIFVFINDLILLLRARRFLFCLFLFIADL